LGFVDGANTFAYVDNNPINLTDAWGLQIESNPTSPTSSSPPTPNSQIPQAQPSCGGGNGDDCAKLIQQINLRISSLKRRYYHIKENKLNLPPTGPFSVGTHQQKFQQEQVNLRKLLEQAASSHCIGYDSDAWSWATIDTPEPDEEE